MTPPCIICGRHTCADYRACRRNLIRLAEAPAPEPVRPSKAVR